MRIETLGGLTVRITGGTDGHGGGNGPLVLLLHGFGAPGDDLVALGQYLDVPAGTRFIFPVAPISIPMGFGDSRAWWMIDMARIQADRAAGRIRDISNEIPRGLSEARERMKGLLGDIHRKLAVDPKHMILGGFSQGAMLACDALLYSAQPYAGLIQLSGTLVAKQEWGPLLAKRKGLPVFQSHGTEDPILAYVMAERLRDEFIQAGAKVDWQPFRGGHEIPEPVLRRLGSFITKALG
ncbi:MAG: putative Carboxylesterase [Nitrospira sp.]|jgi:phospholipase/carboxylesterase|nr:putative Carboxylesterase [Nitrospira sp.]